MTDSVKGFTDVTKNCSDFFTTVYCFAEGMVCILLRTRYGMYVVVGMWLNLLGQSPTANEMRYDLL